MLLTCSSSADQWMNSTYTDVAWRRTGRGRFLAKQVQHLAIAVSVRGSNMLGESPTRETSAASSLATPVGPHEAQVLRQQPSNPTPNTEFQTTSRRQRQCLAGRMRLAMAGHTKYSATQPRSGCTSNTRPAPATPRWCFLFSHPFNPILSRPHTESGCPCAPSPSSRPSIESILRLPAQK